MRTEVTKGDFARMKGRTPQCVSNWIAEGKISPGALVGGGFRAKIWVERADADLARSLDPAQQASQENPVLGALLALPTPPEPAAATPDLPTNVISLRAVGQSDDEDLRRRRKADADKAEHDAEAARRKLAIDEGRWIDAAASGREWAAAFAKELTGIETWQTGTLARQLADEYHLDWKILSAQIRDAFHVYREEVSKGAQAQATAPPVTEAAE